MAIPRGLEASDFTRVAANGLGDPQNSYAFSMHWYEGELFVGTVRNMLAMINFAPPPHPTRLNPWPVRAPRNLYELDLRAQIWNYRPEQDAWSTLYVSPEISRADAEPGPRDIGYRHMTVFQSPRDRAPALYVSSASSNSRGIGAHILRYRAEGKEIDVSSPILGDQEVSTLRTLRVFRDRLYMAPTGKGRAWNASSHPCVYETRDPLLGKWIAVSEPYFGDPSNEAMYSMATFRDHLYVGTLNPVSGYQLWKTRADGRPPYRWTRVLEGGAGRGRLNEGVVSMQVFNDALYLGSGISNGGFNRTYQIGPAAGEIVRVYPDDSWDLVVGTRRLTPQGQKDPRSGFGPGFDNPAAGYIWNMAVHDGWLYAGTFDSTVFMLWRDPKYPPRLKTSLDPQAIVQRMAGCELWRTRDGLSWSPVTRNGFGNPYNYGIRTLCSTPAGLFVGTANPFAPDVAVRMATGWEYVPNPRGGAEVWLGRS